MVELSIYALTFVPILWLAIGGVLTWTAWTAVFVRRQRERSGLLWFAAVLSVMASIFLLFRVITPSWHWVAVPAAGRGALGGPTGWRDVRRLFS